MSNGIKLWIDDIRPAPEGYIWCHSVWKAIKEIEICGNPLEYQEKNFIEIIDIDHDAGDFGPPDYIKVLDWFEETGRNYPIRIHSQNPIGIQNMRAIIRRNGWKEIF